MPRYFQLKVQLQDARPPIWRRFQLSAVLTFSPISTLRSRPRAVGSGATPPCIFRKKPWQDAVAGSPSNEDSDSADVTLSSLFGKRGADRCVYVYDFGDEWRHDVQLEEELDLPEEFKRRLLGGERAFPPEDCGGIWGYQELVRLLRSKGPRTDDGQERLAWLGDWDPELFDLETVRKGFDLPKSPRASKRGKRTVPKNKG